MSKVVKGIKKVFRSVVKVVKKIWKPLVIAAAVYFTAGAAMSYFGAAGATAGVTGATAAAGAGAAGGTAASAAAAIHGAAATMGATTMAAGTTLGGALAGTSVSAVASAAAAAGQAVARGAYTRTAMSMAAGKPPIPAAISAATTPPPAPTTLGGRIGAAVSGMEGYERAMYVQTLISGVSGLLAPKPPTPDQTAQANARFRGSYFGVGEDGKQEFDPVASYNQFWKPRAGESYRDAMPDNRDAQQPASPAAANALATGSGRRVAAGNSGASTHNKQQAPSFIQGDDNADGNAGYYSPDDSYT